MSTPVTDYDNPVDTGSFTTPHAAAGIVLGCMAALWLIRRGFRGVSVGGAGIHV